MRITWMLLGTAFLAGAGSGAELCPVSVRISNLAAAPPVAVFQAKTTAQDAFARIGITLEWRPHAAQSTCRMPIEIRLEAGLPKGDRPNSMAYAKPYVEGGTRIHIFVGRVASMVSADRMGTLLGHVLAHEIAHVLQGVSRHSHEGIMKASWDLVDLRAMSSHALPFAPEDVLLIQSANQRPPAQVAIPSSEGAFN